MLCSTGIWWYSYQFQWIQPTKSPTLWQHHVFKICIPFGQKTFSQQLLRSFFCKFTAYPDCIIINFRLHAHSYKDIRWFLASLSTRDKMLLTGINSNKPSSTSNAELKLLDFKTCYYDIINELLTSSSDESFSYSSLTSYKQQTSLN